ncbi:MAG: type II toxin-antitoxin system RelE/ParE family toxin [Candidatus Methanoperedens sp.]
MAYSISFDKNVKKFLSELNQSQKERIRDKLLSFIENPFSGDIKKIKGREDVFRLRIGDYRVLYILDNKEKSICIVKIDKRSRIYSNNQPCPTS